MNLFDLMPRKYVNLHCNMAASERGFGCFQAAVNLSGDLNQNFVLRLSSVSELEYNAWTDLKDKVSQCSNKLNYQKS